MLNLHRWINRVPNSTGSHVILINAACDTTFKHTVQPMHAGMLVTKNQAFRSSIVSFFPTPLSKFVVIISVYLQVVKHVHLYTLYTLYLENVKVNADISRHFFLTFLFSYLT